jgi:hypothetical protein
VQLASGIWVTSLKQLRFSLSEARALAADPAASVPPGPPRAPQSSTLQESSPPKARVSLSSLCEEASSLMPPPIDLAVHPIAGVCGQTSGDDITTPLSIEAVALISSPPPPPSLGGTIALTTVEATLATDSELESRRASGAARKAAPPPV